MSKCTRHMLYLCIMALLWGCSTDRLMKKEDFTVQEETSEATPPVPRSLPEMKSPAVEEKSPLSGKTITLAAKNAPFTDIFSAIAEVAGLDLVIDSRLVSAEVIPVTVLSDTSPSASAPAQPDQPGGDARNSQSPGSNSTLIPLRPVTVAFNNTPLEQALEGISASLHVFSEIREDCLYVSGTASKAFHLNFVSSRKETRLSVGGDVLGSSSNGENSTTPLSGEFSIRHTTTSEDIDIYAQIEQVIRSSLTPYGTYSLNRIVGFLEINDRRDAVDRIESYIRTLKTYYNSQVLITAKILEVNLSDSCRYGIDWSSIHGTIGDYVFNPIRQNLALSTDNLVPSLEIQVSSQEHGFNAALNALAQYGEIKVLSNPRIRVANGQPALISVGTSTSYIQEIELTITTVEGGTTITSPEVTIGSIFDGVMLGVQPYIDLETNQVNLSITPIKSRVVELKETSISGNIYTLPTVDLKEVTTQLRVKSGSIVALGGLISKSLTDQKKSIPILGDIPILGYLFSQKIKTVETDELVILLEPVIIEQ
ncbi:MAG: pilus (MSHA type) biogenesis protein MshL [Desulfomonilia bacterium]|nr:pilus (MSHA type) biogenesis protein MshL [Desulfomonilia bacterium]HPW68299.1 pilus (MSHA type) biogenesis protein MshL [Deltaproteobacteria bacterium]